MLQKCCRPSPGVQGYVFRSYGALFCVERWLRGNMKVFLRFLTFPSGEKGMFVAFDGLTMCGRWQDSHCPLAITAQGAETLLLDLNVWLEPASVVTVPTLMWRLLPLAFRSHRNIPTGAFSIVAAGSNKW
jgi:hypothetical protein